MYVIQVCTSVLPFLRVRVTVISVYMKTGITMTEQATQVGHNSIYKLHTTCAHLSNFI